MKILSYEIRDKMIIVTTDNKDRPEFVYFKDRFGSKKDLEKEIEKSIGREEKKKDKKDKKLKKLKKELDK